MQDIYVFSISLWLTLPKYVSFQYEPSCLVDFNLNWFTDVDRRNRAGLLRILYEENIFASKCTIHLSKISGILLKAIYIVTLSIVLEEKKKKDLGKILRALVLLEGKDVIGRSSSITVVSTPKYQSLSLSSDQLQDTQPIQTQKANHNYAWIELKSVHLLYETKTSVQV